MQSSNLITSDLRMCLVEGNRDFQFLTIYRGVQFVCFAELQAVTEERAYFVVRSGNPILLARDRSAVALSNGLIDPFVIQVASFEMTTGKLEAADMVYAGDTVGNRREHRVAADPSVMVDVDWEDQKLRGNLLDLSLSGAGICIPFSGTSVDFRRGKTFWLTLHLPEGGVQLPGTILRYQKRPNCHWFAVEFTGKAPGKVAILHHINRRLSEIRAEVQQMYAEAQKNT